MRSFQRLAKKQQATLCIDSIGKADDGRYKHGLNSVSMEKPLISMIEVQFRSFIESLRPTDEEIRKQLDFGYSWDGQSALLFEIRPQWNDPTKILELPFAKLRFVKSARIWKLYWMRGSGKWEAYEPQPESTDVYELLTEIKNDAYGCFFG